MSIPLSDIYGAKYIHGGYLPGMTAKIILLSDVYDMKKRKEDELAFYRAELAKLTAKMDQVKREIDLTGKIIEMIETEKIIDIFPTN